MVEFKLQTFMLVAIRIAQCSIKVGGIKEKGSVKGPNTEVISSSSVWQHIFGGMKSKEA